MMTLSTDAESWLLTEAPGVLSSLGVRTGHSVMDFGCGPGRYTLPMAWVVGKTGRVFAIERNGEKIAELRARLTKAPPAGRIHIVRTSQTIAIDTHAGYFLDSVFLFDVLQHVANYERLLGDLSRMVKTAGFMYVYPAAVPHPDAVDMKKVSAVLKALTWYEAKRQRYRLLHNTHIVTDTVYSYCRN